ncbi:hypothetical protein VCRA2110O318_320006 [Vibrio crassostreae]|nr:hypothetical protein VCRA2110O318_320006 [Vibrio crassostreae]CAK2450911.1 hypothetical protein VCRA2110O319_220029 [Vibrio crassostreae]CAK2772075.1 hypothetical protein VCRA217O317_220060 [Vibrio crassostreae]
MHRGSYEDKKVPKQLKIKYNRSSFARFMQQIYKWYQNEN